MTLAVVAAGAVGGAIFGSFLATLILRWPRGEQVVSGRSKCDGCGRTLGGLELIPIVSALAARGRCRTCGAPIASLHLWVELVAAALAATALLVSSDVHGLALATFWLLLLAPAVLDLRHHWLPDRLTILLALAGLLLGHFVSGALLADRLIGGLAGFCSLWLTDWLYRRSRGRRGIGGGDPKFLGAIGLWTGWQAIPIIVLVAAVAGLAAAIAKRQSGSDKLPFGTLLAVGAIAWSFALAAMGAAALF